MKNRITIITPSLNSLELLKETVFSVLNQKAFIEKDVELEYIICDGGSVDGTVNWLESLNLADLKLISEKDKGLYDALSKGLSIATGNIVGYINCGDYYSPYAFDILKDIFASYPDVKWITGYRTWYNNKGYMVAADLPFRYRRKFILKGIYGSLLPYIQQESTFWRSELLTGIDMKKLSGFSLAGDYYLWHEFARIAELHIVQAYIGGFRKHQGQLSEQLDKYEQEMARIVGGRVSIADYFLVFYDRLIWCMNDEIKFKLNRGIMKL